MLYLNGQVYQLTELVGNAYLEMFDIVFESAKKHIHKAIRAANKAREAKA